MPVTSGFVGTKNEIDLLGSDRFRVANLRNGVEFIPCGFTRSQALAWKRIVWRGLISFGRCKRSKQLTKVGDYQQWEISKVKWKEDLKGMMCCL